MVKDELVGVGLGGEGSVLWLVFCFGVFRCFGVLVGSGGGWRFEVGSVWCWYLFRCIFLSLDKNHPDKFVSTDFRCCSSEN